MTTQKFKVGDRVNWKDCEGRARSGVIVEDPRGYSIPLAGHCVKEAQELKPGWWHESHLSLDVPDPKKYATDLEVQLGIEIINLNKKCSSQVESIVHLSNRLTEEIGGRVRERIAKAEALAAESLALDSLHEIAATLGDKSNLTPHGLREKVPALAEWKMKELEASYKQLNHASELLICETESFSKERRLREAVQGDNRRLIDSKMTLLQEVAIERKAKEAAQKELVQIKENEDWGCGKLSELANELSAERCAKKSAQNELADVRQDLADLRKDLADLRIISKRLAL